MKQRLESDLRFVAQHLRLKLRDTKGHTIVQRAFLALSERYVPLPILGSEDHLGVPLGGLIRSVYSDMRFDFETFMNMWSFVAGLVKNGGWKPATPFYGAVSQMFPDMKLRMTPPRGVDADVRGILSQALRLANFCIPDSSIIVSRFETVLRVNRDLKLAVAAESVTWKNGHYIRGNKHPIDFRQWVYRAPPGERSLSVKSTALMQHLVASFPLEADEIRTFFKLVAFIGPDAEYVVCEPFDIVLTEETVDLAAEAAALVETQRKLRAF